MAHNFSAFAKPKSARPHINTSRGAGPVSAPSMPIATNDSG